MVKEHIILEKNWPNYTKKIDDKLNETWTEQSKEQKKTHIFELFISLKVFSIWPDERITRIWIRTQKKKTGIGWVNYSRNIRIIQHVTLFACSLSLSLPLSLYLSLPLSFTIFHSVSHEQIWPVNHVNFQFCYTLIHIGAGTYSMSICSILLQDWLGAVCRTLVCCNINRCNIAINVENLSATTNITIRL